MNRPEPIPESVKERTRVIEYLQRVEVDGMTKILSFSAAYVSIYDKNDKLYKISRTATLKEVKAIIEKITKINSGTNR